MIRKLTLSYTLCALMLLSTSAFAVVKVSLTSGKYQVGMSYSPFMIAAVWFDGSLKQCRVATEAELELIYPKITQKDVAKATSVLEQEKTRALTQEEKVFCDEVYATRQSHYVAVNPRYPNNKTRPVRQLDTLTTVKSPRAVIGSPCGEFILKRAGYSWYAITINNVKYSTVCE